MKSDLTCPVEITKVTVKREMRDTKESEQIVCLIEFFNLSEKVIDSLQMNIICFDAAGTRLGGRLVRSAVKGEPRGNFSGSFMPERVDGAVRVEAAVEKVWYADGVVWRREDRNVREYTPNTLSEGRELDRLRAVAGPDAAGYAREDDIVWLCVCGRANRTSDDKCIRCEREREQVLRDYCFAAIDATAGKKERALEAQTKDTLRRSSETTVKEQAAIISKSKKRRKRLKTVVVLLACAAALLAAARWGVPYGACWYAQYQMDSGKLSDAKAIFAFVDEYWPGMLDAGSRAKLAEEKIIEGLIAAGSDLQLEEAARRAKALDSENAPALYERAMLDRAQGMIDAGDTDGAEALLSSMEGSKAAKDMHMALIYDIAMEAVDRVNYAAAIKRFESLGDYKDAKAQKEESIYDYGRQLMREGEYQLAHEQLLLVSGKGDAIALIRQCRYEIACDAQENGDYIAAADLFDTLGVYEEAETRAAQCRYTAGINALGAGSLEIAAKQLKLAGDYEDAQARFADAALTLGSAALENKAYETAIEWLGQLPREGEAGDALDKATYAYALELEAAGKKEQAALEFASLGGYEDAEERAKALEYALACEEMEAAPESALGRFEGLGDYKDAKKLALSCRYQMAKTLYAGGEYEAAMQAFEQLKGHEDAASQARRSRYALAGERFAQKDYEGAAALYEACGAYLDSEDRAMRAHYEQAAALEAAQEYAKASEAFAALGSYEDAKLRVRQNEDAWLKAAYQSARMDSELGDYDSVIRTLLPLWKSELPERYAQVKEMYVSACMSRARELIAMHRPLDALEILESIKEVNKSAKDLLGTYVYRIIGRWKDSRGVEYVFRRDGTCSVAGQEMYFGGGGYDITMGDAPYPTRKAYGVVSLRNNTLTLKNAASGSNVRLSYVGEPTPPAVPTEATAGEATPSQAESETETEE
ncbi:MAG: hypothetical protein IKU73_04460 [Clostridia bacterium]|nr:hypothetical protein [Clostridia bacterium]